MAASDYVVLYTNPRGSTSYGEEFGNLIHHDYPGDDFYDLDSGVDAVIAKGYIDPEQVFVTGGSGGGVLTCWMIGGRRDFEPQFCLSGDQLVQLCYLRYWKLTARYWFRNALGQRRALREESLLSVVRMS
jgi:hypothetical protein